MRLQLKFVAIALLSLCYVNAQEITDNKFGKGIINVIAKDSSWSMKFATRMQFLSTTNWDMDGNGDFINSPETNFLVRRARFKFNGFAFTPKLKYKMELGLSNRDISGASKYTKDAPRYILDAVIKWNFYNNFTLWAGQTKLPGNRERVISSGNLQFVDRSLLNSKFNIDRDLGVQLRHHFNLTDKFIVREALAISQGEGRNITSGNIGGHQYTGRVELLPFGKFAGKGDYSSSDLKREKSPKLAIGVTLDYNADAVKTKSNQGKYLYIDGTDGDSKLSDDLLHESNVATGFIDAMFKYNGISIMAEYADRRADRPNAINADGTTTGKKIETGNSFNIQGGYLFKSNYELAARYTSVDYYSNSFAPLKQYTLGASRYIKGHKLKVQTDISYNETNDISSGLMYRLQFDIHF